MKQSHFYLSMVAGMVAIVIALGFNAYANWTAIECTSVYYTAHSDDSFGTLVPGTYGMVHHTCFDRSGKLLFDFDRLDRLITTSPRFPPLGE